VKEMIARMEADYQMSRLLWMRSGWLKNQGRRNTRETSLAKWFSTVASETAAGNAVQVHGANGYSDEYPVGRFYRNCKGAVIYEGTREIHTIMQADYVLNPAKEDVDAIMMEKTGGLGVDVVLEMAGHPDSIRTAFDIVRRGGRISLLGLTSKPIQLNFSEDIIFKGITIQGINGRRMYQTWYQMTALLKAGKLNLHPAITDRISMKDFGKAMERLRTGEASKILVYPNGVR